MLQPRRALGTWSNRSFMAVAVCMLVAGVSAIPAGTRRTMASPGAATVDRFDDDPSANVCWDEIENDCSLRGAIRLANSDPYVSHIEIPHGTYMLTIPGDGEDNCNTGDLDIDNYGDGDIVISAAEGAHPVIVQTVSDRVFDIDANLLTTIRGPMTIMGGNVVSPPDGNDGGLIRIWGDGLRQVVLEDVVLMGGAATGGGGCLNMQGSSHATSLDLSNVTLLDCVAEGDGGGLLATGDSSLTFDRLVVKNNTAHGAGGGIAILGNSVTADFTDSTIQSNVSEDPVTGSGEGGGIYLGSGEALIERSTIARNRAGAGTGVIGYGGGLHLETSDAILHNSTVSGNIVEGASAQGSAVFVGSFAGFSNLTVEQSTIVGEPASSLAWSAVGIAATGAVAFEASIIEGGCAIEPSGTVTSNGYNVERPIDGSVTTQCGLDNPSDVLATSPFLRPLAGYGGPTQTHALKAGAPAVFLVSSGACQPTDQRLAPRVYLFCDAGSYESSGQAPGKWVFSDDLESLSLGAWSSTSP